MHACNALTLDQLLSLRDGEPTDAHVAQHVDHCAHCAAELKRLHALQTALRALPTLSPPPYDVEILRSRVCAARQRRTGWAVAAGLGALTIGLIATVDRTAMHDPITVSASASPERTLATEPATDVRSLVIRSQELEAYLQQLPSRPQVERADTTAAIESLEQGIQWVDYQLSLAGAAGLTESQSAELWEKRVTLMDSLFKVRYAEAQRTGVVFVSLPGSSL